jgi:HKD family nuclease
VKSDFILQGFMARTHVSALERILSTPNLQDVLISVAYLNQGGVKLIADKIKPVAKSTTVFAGIRNDTTSRQGLDQLLALGVKLYVVDTGSYRLVFHPKIYMTTAPDEARLVIGSANFTAGGLRGNIEGGVALDLDRKNAADEALRKSIADEFATLPGKFPKHVLHITKNSELLALEKEGRLLDESAVEPPHPITVAKTTSGDKLERIKLLTTLPKKALTTKAAPSKATIPPKAPSGATPTPSANIGFELVWESAPLTERDLTIPQGANTHATGSMNLDKGTLPDNIDFRHYFRNSVFNALTWNPAGPTVDEAHAKFQLVIKGINYGEFDLRIAHTTSTTSKSYLQRNAMTRLSWGPVKQYVADKQFIDRTLSLYRDTNDPARFLIEIV